MSSSPNQNKMLTASLKVNLLQDGRDVLFHYGYWRHMPSMSSGQDHKIGRRRLIAPSQWYAHLVIRECATKSGPYWQILLPIPASASGRVQRWNACVLKMRHIAYKTRNSSLAVAITSID